MNDKLQELTDKLYTEGLTKGRQEADEIVSNAKIEARDIIKEAESKAAIIISDARKQAAEAEANAEAEIKLASRQVMNDVKHAVENTIITRTIAPTVTAALDDRHFMQSLLKTVTEKFSLEENFNLSIIIPEGLQKEITDYAEKQISAELQKGLEIKQDKRFKSGFKIGPKDGGYYISFTEESFSNLFSEYLRPKIKKILFG